MATKFGNGISLEGQKIVALADGALPDDAATYGQLLALLEGLAWKDEVRAASTANVSVSSAPATLDGVTLANGDRVLLKDQTAGAENGVYDFHGAGSPLTRASDSNTAGKLKAATVIVTEGTANADKSWTQATDNVTLGTTALVWARTGGNLTTAGNGMDLSGGAFSVKTPNNSWLVVDGTGVYADKTKVVGKFAASIGDGSATVVDVVHGLSTEDVTWSLRDVATKTGYMTDWKVVDAATIRFTFGAAPALAALRVVVHG